MKTTDFRTRIASIALGISEEEVILNRGMRLAASREKWMKKNFGTSGVKRTNHTQWKS